MSFSQPCWLMKAKQGNACLVSRRKAKPVRVVSFAQQKFLRLDAWQALHYAGWHSQRS